MVDISTLGFSSKVDPSTSVLRREESALSNAEKTQKTLANEFDEFMLLLTTQLQNQDPTEPLDTNQFTQQLVQFTGVEQSVEMNKNLEKLIALNATQKTDSAVNFIGKYVETSGNSGFLNEGKASFSYDLPKGATTASITVLDKVGRPVYTKTVEGAAGEYNFAWDGTNSFDGTDMPDGEYQFGVTVRDAQNKPLTAKTYTAGIVTSVALDGTEPVMTLNGVLEVPSSKISSVVGLFNS